jgi:hypothetical protein
LFSKFISVSKSKICTWWASSRGAFCASNAGIENSKAYNMPGVALKGSWWWCSYYYDIIIIIIIIIIAPFGLTLAANKDILSQSSVREP